MPEEFSRTTKRKTIILPSGDKIRAPVISKISFIDPFHQYQEFEFSLDNTADADRKVHVDIVNPVIVDEDGVPTEDPPTVDTSEKLYIERIEEWKVSDPFNQYQESRTQLDNVTGNDQVPPHFSNHTKTHIYRYFQDPENPDDEGVWVDSELIDEFAVIDAFEQYQERRFALINPTNEEFRGGDLSGQAAEDDPDITIVVGDSDGEGTEDNPVRIDPFQNIVNWHGGPKFYFTATPELIPSANPAILPTDSGVPSSSPSPNPVQGTFFTGQYQATCHVDLVRFAVPSHSANTSDGPIPDAGPNISVDVDIPLTPFAYIGVGNYFIQGPGDELIVPDSPPLVIDGHPIPGFSNQLTCQAKFYAVPEINVGNYSFPGPGNINWFNSFGGYPTGWPYPPGGPAVTFPMTSVGPPILVGTINITISTQPFDFNGIKYIAKGIAIDAAFNSNFTFQIYCVANV